VPEASTIVEIESVTPEKVVEEFGRHLKNVSITAPPEIAASTIRKEYAEFVHSRLLEQWIASPSTAPGRAVSSPWPDRIEVKAITPVEGAANVSGEIVEMTSTGEANRIPVRIHLVRDRDRWVIDAFDVQSNEDVSKIIEQYYAAISARDYDAAYAMWGASGPPNQTREQFVAGFADTAKVAVHVGTPGRVEGAAGSRYVTVPVTVTATMRDGATQRFTGTYTLRQSVVEGGDPQWRIYRGELRAGN